MMFLNPSFNKNVRLDTSHVGGEDMQQLQNDRSIAKRKLPTKKNGRDRCEDSPAPKEFPPLPRNKICFIILFLARFVPNLDWAFQDRTDIRLMWLILVPS